MPSVTLFADVCTPLPWPRFFQRFRQAGEDGRGIQLGSASLKGGHFAVARP